MNTFRVYSIAIWGEVERIIRDVIVFAVMGSIFVDITEDLYWFVTFVSNGFIKISLCFFSLIYQFIGQVKNTAALNIQEFIFKEFIFVK